MEEEITSQKCNHIAPISVSILKTDKILHQLKNSIFEIINNTKIYTGFLCKFPNNISLQKALILNYQIIDEKFIKEYNMLTLLFNNDKQKIEIDLKRERIIYHSKKLDVTIIEILNDDDLKNENCLEFDDDILNDDSDVFYKDESIYVLQYKNKGDASVSYGLITEGDGYGISIYSDININSLGAPILNLSTNKVIGICKELIKEPLNRKGLNFKYVIQELKLNSSKNEIINEANNEIIIRIKVDKNDINQKINYFFNILKNSNEEEGKYSVIRTPSVDEIIKTSMYLNDFSPRIFIDNDEQSNQITNYYFIPKEAKSYTIRIKFRRIVKNCSYMFYNCDKITSIDLSHFNSNMVENMKCMFYGCINLRHINFKNVNTENVTNMEKMFYMCYNLINLDLSYFNTKKVIYMDFMFYNTKNLENIIFSKDFDTSDVINMDYMFSGCLSLREINLSTFKTGNVTNMAHMFYNCRNLKKLDLSRFDTENVTNMDLMFFGCRGLQRLDLSNFNTKNVTNMGWMFYGCKNLKEIIFGNFDTENVRDMEEMFSACKNLKFLDLAKFNTKNVLYMDFMFDLCKNLEKIKISDTFNTGNVTNM